MKTIGRILVCALLAVVLTKNVLATSSAGNVELSRKRSNETETRTSSPSRLIPKPDPDVGDDASRAPTLSDVSESENDESEVGFEESRTFGGHKRLQFMLMPLMYKMGVMMTMLMVLIAISAKGLVIGVILLILKISTFLSKFHSWHEQPWSSQQPIHVHVHGSLPYAQSQAYHGWETSGPGIEDHYYYKG